MKNTLKKSLAVVLSVLMLLFTLVLSASAATESAIDESKLERYHVTSEKVYTLVGGVTEREIVLNNASGTYQQYIFVLEIAPDNENVSVITGYNDGDADDWAMNTVRDQAHALEDSRDVEVIASVNASFYNTRTGEPTGLFVMEGEAHTAASSRPYFFGVTKSGDYVIRSSGGRTDDLESAVGGNHLLVSNGNWIKVEEGKLAPRTAVGLREDGTLVICVNDGRQDPYSYGFDVYEMANVMYALGCKTAMNLDGGASSTFLTQREGTDDIDLRNQPSNGYERKVAVTLHVVTTAEKTGEFDHIVFNEPIFYTNVKKSMNIDVYAVDKNGYKTDFPEGGYLQLSDESLGTLNGTKFTSNDKTGTTTISYILNGEVLASAEIEVYRENAITSFFNDIQDFFNKIRHMFERIFEELGERLFGI